MPGPSANIASIAAATAKARGYWDNWRPKSAPIFSWVAVRVTMRPADVEMIRAGTWVTRPSPDRQLRVDTQGVGEVHSAHENADDESADHVDQRDDQSRDRVAAHKTRRAVHRAVEVRLLLDVAPARTGFGFGNQASIEIGVHAHLLAGHGVQRESRRNLRNALCAARNHHELDHDEDHEDDKTHDEVAARHETAKSLDHLARVGFGKDEAGRGYVEAETEQGQHQQQ